MGEKAYLAAMSLSFASLNSGSNGNCYYIGSERHAILIDAGISCRETERRMERAGLSPGQVRAVFISHEHRDHLYGAEGLSKKHHIPLYFRPAAYLNTRISVAPELLHFFDAGGQISIGDLVIHPFPKLHDGIDPYSFTVSCNGITVGVFTDIGEACKHVSGHFSQCHAAFLEANYDEEMLENGRYPLHLKRRIRSRVGHLSNMQALELFKDHRAPFLSHLILSHLSEQNNDPSLVNDLFQAHANGTRITIASRYYESEVFRISSDIAEKAAEGC